VKCIQKIFRGTWVVLFVVLFLFLAREVPATEQAQKKRIIRVDARELSTDLANVYLDLIQRYRQGDLSVMETLVTWTPKQCARSIYSLNLLEPEQKLLEAAFVLHAEASLELMKVENEDLGYWHVAFARAVNEFMSGARKSRLLKEYLLLLGYFFQRPGIQPLDGPSREFFDEALELFPEDPEVLLALGSIFEAVGRLEEDKGKLEKAAEFYRQCVAADSDLVEGHLRLGAIRLALGDGKEAKKELEWVLSNGDDPYLVYLAQIFLGDYHKKNKRWHEATLAYESAAKTRPEWQVACLSLSHALQRSGNRSRAGEIMKRCLALPAESAEYEDGWWRYHLGQSHRVEAMLERWRKEVEP
jgi:tetratricopeptide (TPR) repeat protein